MGVTWNPASFRAAISTKLMSALDPVPLPAAVRGPCEKRRYFSFHFILDCTRRSTAWIFSPGLPSPAFIAATSSLNGLPMRQWVSNELFFSISFTFSHVEV